MEEERGRRRSLCKKERKEEKKEQKIITKFEEKKEGHSKGKNGARRRPTRGPRGPVPLAKGRLVVLSARRGRGSADEEQRGGWDGDGSSSGNQGQHWRRSKIDGDDDVGDFLVAVSSSRSSCFHLHGKWQRREGRRLFLDRL